MKTKSTVSARDDHKAVSVEIKLDTTKYNYTRGEHAKLRNELVDGIHSALRVKFHVSNIRIR